MPRPGVRSRVDIQRSTKAYEAWLAGQMSLVQADLRAKHESMAGSAMTFLRGSSYRWVERWSELAEDAAEAPIVLAVGDLHVEVFGTWRDAEGRLVWGITDFDEAASLPFTADLVRLAASAAIAIREERLACCEEDAWDALLEGYTKGIRRDGAPFVLAERHRWLRDVAEAELEPPKEFWTEMDELPAYRGAVPVDVRKLLVKSLPEPEIEHRFVHRQAGTGSLGRPRYTLLADWRGGMIAREAKALAPSVWHWLERDRAMATTDYARATQRSIRAPDLFVSARNRWVARRLAPDCSEIELDDLPKKWDELRLLRAMGRETANVHLGSRDARRRVGGDLARRPRRWLRHAAKRTAEAVMEDWKDWKRGRSRE